MVWGGGTYLTPREACGIEYVQLWEYILQEPREVVRSSRFDVESSWQVSWVKRLWRTYHKKSFPDDRSTRQYNKNGESLNVANLVITGLNAFHALLSIPHDDIKNNICDSEATRDESVNN